MKYLYMFWRVCFNVFLFITQLIFGKPIKKNAKKRSNWPPSLMREIRPNPTAIYLITINLIYAIVARIIAATHTRLALKGILVKWFGVYHSLFRRATFNLLHSLHLTLHTRSGHFFRAASFNPLHSDWALFLHSVANISKRKGLIRLSRTSLNFRGL